MISNAILFLIGGWVGTFSLIYNLFDVPDVTTSPSVVSGLSAAAGYLNVSYSVMPITTVSILGCFSILIVFEASLIAYRLIKWGYSKIPGIS